MHRVTDLPTTASRVFVAISACAAVDAKGGSGQHDWQTAGIGPPGVGRWRSDAHALSDKSEAEYADDGLDGAVEALGAPLAVPEELSHLHLD